MFNAVAIGAIEVLVDTQNQPWFKRADLGRYLGILKVRDSFTNFQAEYIKKREEIPGAGCRSGAYGGGFNPHDVFYNLDGGIEAAMKSKIISEILIGLS